MAKELKEEHGGTKNADAPIQDTKGHWMFPWVWKVYESYVMAFTVTRCKLSGGLTFQFFDLLKLFTVI